MSTFKEPPFDDSLLLPQWLQYNAHHSPDHPLFTYALDAEVKFVTWFEAVQAIEMAARMTCAHLKVPDLHGSAHPPPIIGILANIDLITYHTLFLGIVRTGATAFLISTRNSPVAVAHLLQKTGTHKLYFSSDEAIKELTSAALAIVREEGHEVDLFPVPSFQNLFSPGSHNDDLDPVPEFPNDLMDSPAVILHSSGSTAFPKPIPVTHRVVLQWARSTKIPGTQSKHKISINSLPAFHLAGFSMVPWAACTGLILSVFPPVSPPLVPSPDSLLEAALNTRSTMMMAVPFFYEAWSRSSRDVAKLKTFHTCIHGGSLLNREIGAELERAGVPLSAIYGATELGILTLNDPETLGEWEWATLSPEIEISFIPQGGSELYEVVCVQTQTYSPAIINTQVDGKPAYATNDLVFRHPINPRRFKIYGRKDEQLVLSTGEKTNPVPIEAIICEDPLVQAALMFGSGRDQNGIIIQPAEGHEFDSTDTILLARFRNDIWPSVMKANAFAPSHSRLYKEMILVAKPSKPFELTVKKTIRRAAALNLYKDDIEAAYDAVHTSANPDITPPAVWMDSEVLTFVRKVVHKVMGKIVADTDDIFSRGADSLQATYIRNSMIRAIRLTSEKSLSRISEGLVYANPTIAGLSEYLVAQAREYAQIGNDGSLSKAEAMTRMVSEMTTDFPEHRPSSEQTTSDGDVVLLTGTTGALGSQLLSHFVSLTDVSRIYAINRPSKDDGKTLKNRQAAALSERGLDTNIIDSSKVTLIEGNIAAPDLGINSSLFHEICTNVTHIVHNAWSVNFNFSLASFRPMIQSVRNVINLALRSRQKVPPRIIFMGSVSVLRNWSDQSCPIEVSITDPSMALGSGYSESKWVSERILEKAAERTPLRPIIVRIGQISSNSTGSWNSRDWLPALVRSGQVLGLLPGRDDNVAWIPLDTAAQFICDVRNCTAQHLHLQHPHPIPWSTIFKVFSSTLNVPLVTWTEWLSKLEESSYGPEKNPAEYLVNYFRDCSATALEYKEALGIPLLNLNQALKASTTLSDPSLLPISQEDAEKWIVYWKSTGFLA